jgi:transcriptional regulator with XRE-family HTH domain
MKENLPLCHPVANHPLQNYLRTHRRRTGLSQEEVANLLGAASGTKVSRHENFARRPAVPTVFAYEIIFNRPARELFAGNYQSIRLAVQERARHMVKRLNAQPDAQTGKTLRKLELLRTIVEPKPSSVRNS